ncbi:MAG: hypothetical protein ABSA33_03680, partial [Candidatus Micrarchaeaceae archaeon]
RCGAKICRHVIREFKYLPKQTKQNYIKLGIVPKWLLKALSEEADSRIPKRYRKFWYKFKTNSVLYHITPRANLKNIMKKGLEPRDPAPRNWRGMHAVFMGYPRSSEYKPALKNVLAHAKKKSEDVVRLHIRTKQQLYRSSNPSRTFQVMSLDYVPARCIIKIEDILG